MAKQTGELTIVERQVRRMMDARAKEREEELRLENDANALRKAGEARLRELELDGDDDADAANVPVVVELRKMTSIELGMAYAWMRKDEIEYGDDSTKFWSNAAGSVQELFEETHAPGDEALLNSVEPWPKLLGAFARGKPVPVGFAMLKSDGLTVEACGVRQSMRRLGYGRQIAMLCIERARVAAAAGAGPPVYRIDEVPSAVAFWKSLGFRPSKEEDDAYTRVMRKVCGDVSLELAFTGVVNAQTKMVAPVAPEESSDSDSI